MKKYFCSICGYVYDESKGDPDSNIAAGTKWEDIPDDWVCPACGALKSEFEEKNDNRIPVEKLSSVVTIKGEKELTFAELSILCSNLSKGCEKQYRSKEAGLFNQLSEYYSSIACDEVDDKFEDLALLVENDLASGYNSARDTASAVGDRGALRAVVWGEKTTKVLNSLLSRYEKQKDALLIQTNVFVCEICGFIYIGDNPPDICPVCKVPSIKIMKIQRGK